MKLHIYIDTSELDSSSLIDIYAPISKEMSDWIGEKQNIKLLSSYCPSEEIEENELQENIETLSIGISIELKSKHKLKEPLNFLYTLAKTYQCEFAIAIVEESSNEPEDVCYFGYEEGRPDLFEVANYIGL